MTHRLQIMGASPAALRENGSDSKLPESLHVGAEAINNSIAKSSL